MAKQVTATIMVDEIIKLFLITEELEKDSAKKKMEIESLHEELSKLNTQLIDGQQREQQLEEDKTFLKENLRKKIQEKDEQDQEKAALIQKFNEDTTHLMETKTTLEAHIDQLQKELQEGRLLTSRLMKQKGKEVKTDTDSKKDEEIKSLKNKLEEAEREEKKLTESLEQQLQKIVISQSGMHVCVLIVDMMCLYCFRFYRL